MAPRNRSLRLLCIAGFEHRNTGSGVDPALHLEALRLHQDAILLNRPLSRGDDDSFGGLNFDNYFLPLSSTVTATNLADAQRQGAVLAYGAFLTVLINFLIVAWILFMLVKMIGRMMHGVR